MWQEGLDTVLLSPVCDDVQMQFLTDSSVFYLENVAEIDIKQQFL